MRLLPRESILYQSNNHQFVLTTHRIRLQTTTFGNANIESVMLEHLVACSFVKHSSPVYLIIAGITFVLGSFLGFATKNNLIIFVSLAIAGFFVVLYLVNQEQMIALDCSGKTLHISAEGMGLPEVEHFIDHIEMAKNARYFSR